MKKEWITPEITCLDIADTKYDSQGTVGDGGVWSGRNLTVEES